MLQSALPRRMSCVAGQGTQTALDITAVQMEFIACRWAIPCELLLLSPPVGLLHARPSLLLWLAQAAERDTRAAGQQEETEAAAHKVYGSE